MIERQIKKLLYRYDCVIIPNFGAFLARNEPSQYHENTRVFYPPHRSLNFNAQLMSDDGLLVNSISKAENISFDEAKKEVHLFVEDLNAFLKKEKKVTLSQLGTFEYTADHITKFYPDENNSLRTDTFGLTPIMLNKARIESTESISNDSVAEPQVIDINDQDNNRKKGLRKLYRYASVSLLALGLTGTISYTIIDKQDENKNDKIVNQADGNLRNKLKNADFELQNALPALTLKIDTKAKYEKQIDKRFHIIAGAFRSKANALKKVELLQRKGFNSTILGQNSYKLHQVTFESFKSREKAIQSLKNIQSNEEENAWLLVK